MTLTAASSGHATETGPAAGTGPSASLAAPASIPPQARSARVLMVDTLQAAEVPWRLIERDGLLAHYHRFGWARAWLAHIGARAGEAARIAVGLVDGEPAFVWPFALSRAHGVTTLTWLGQSHANQNTGIWTRRAYAELSADTLHGALIDAARAAGADRLALHNIPAVWEGRPHPLAADNGNPSPSPVFRGPLDRPFEALFADTHSKASRKKLLRKRKALEEAGDYAVKRAQTAQEIETGLAAFFEQRAVRARETGIPNAFSGAPAQAFLRALLSEPDGDGGPLLDLRYLEAGGRIRATYLGGIGQGAYYGYANSIAHDELTALSPGVVLLTEIVRNCCADPAIAVLDLGLGEERYKLAWTAAQDLVDREEALTAAGRIVTAADRLRLAAKRTIRTSPALWSLVRKARRIRARLG
ncbi:GNAT family N-acetyltransferase [Polymorphum gilvum]|nr:GNAT family N-acetyltransferase [Polymorphum gilvum]